MATRADTAPLIDSLPDLVLVLRRDGIILDHTGGRAVPALTPQERCVGHSVESIWPKPVVQLVRQLVRKAITARATLETRFTDAGQRYQVRATAEGPDRALCLIRHELRDASTDDVAAQTGSQRRPYLDRRGFLQQFQEALSRSVLMEKPASVGVIMLEGVDEIGRLDGKLAEQVVSIAIMRLTQMRSAEFTEVCSCIGQLGETQLALVVNTADRRTIDAVLSEACSSLRTPVDIGDATLHMTPHAGVAVLGRDATSTIGLLDHARIAAGEARRGGSQRVHFFSDTLRLQSVTRLDRARELRDAIAARAMKLRYIGRHDLDTGRMCALVAYVTWPHALRGDVPAKEFLGVAEATGVSMALSRAMLEELQADYRRMGRSFDASIRLSFGPLRHHLLHEEFYDDIACCVADVIPAERLEIRIAESTFIVMQPALCERLQRLGIHVTIDEVARGFGSIDRLARAPLWGMQLDRGWVEALHVDSVAHRVCCAGIRAANALGLVPIALGVNDERQRQALIELGCRYASGELYDREHAALLAKAKICEANL